EELEPLVEEGEKWRALKGTYPDSYPSHSTEQIHYFDDQGLMRRQGYTGCVRPNLGAAPYIYDPPTFAWFLFTTQRRIYSRSSDGALLRDRLLISADLDDFRLWRSAP